ncbi:Fructosamine kinase-domain-containing protein [Cladorrhinum sp. PSN332]|nr:Fructosamine kinase-domain-containing protein [Cladorrhinum sp. PSN332]
MADSQYPAIINQDNEPEPISIKEMLIRLGGVFPTDEAVIEALPKGTTFLSAERVGTSAWTVTGRIMALDRDGIERPYVLIVAFGEHGHVMLNGEWEFSQMIYEIIPDFIPIPCDGKLANTVDWDASWASSYRKLLLGVCKLDLEANGPWPELERATAQICDVVIPRLLDNLRTSEGEPIKPCIIHGDFSVFRANVYTRHYLRNYPAAEPADEFDDCNRLYSLKGTINYSAGHPGTPLEKTAYNDMCYLCEKYAPIDGIDKYDPMIDPSITRARIVPHLAEGLL